MPRTRKRTIDSKTSLELLEYTVAQLGGHETVLEAFFAQRIRAMLANGLTFGQLLGRIAKDPDLDKAFRGMRLSDVVNSEVAISGKKQRIASKHGPSGVDAARPAAKAHPTKSRAKRSPNLSGEERTTVVDTISTILGEKPWIQVAELRASLSNHPAFVALKRDLSGPQLHTILRELRQAKKIKTDDSLGVTRLRYANRNVKGSAPAE